MTVLYWVLAGLLAAVFLFTGVFKLVLSKEQLKGKGMNWTDGFSQNGIRGIAIAEVLGAVGVVVPPATGIAVWLAPVAAVGLAVIMAGATRAHSRLGDTVAPNVILGVLALATAVVGFIVWL